MSNKTGYFVNCENCGKEVYQTKTQYSRSKHHFCSKECNLEFRHKETHEVRFCEICGESFEVLKKDFVLLNVKGNGSLHRLEN